MKKLVVIAGVTGSIGQEMLRRYLIEDDILIYGISRKGILSDVYTIFPDHHLMINVDLSNTGSINAFVSKIPKHTFKSISYIHLVGEFKTEINEQLEVIVENDVDGDGIDDGVHTLVAKAYKDMVTALGVLSKKIGAEFNTVSFGSLSDPYNINCFQSFRKSRDIVKAFSQEFVSKNQNTNMYLFNTSTILAADEMLERPFIFATKVNPIYWITPFELVCRTFEYMHLEKGIVEHNIYIPHPHFSSDYFDEGVTYKRRIHELYNKTT